MATWGAKKPHAAILFPNKYVFFKTVRRLFNFDLCAGSFQLRFDLFGVFFNHPFLDRFRGRLDQSFGFFQSKAGDGPDFFYHIDFFVTNGGQDDIKFRFFFFLGSRCI